MISMTELIKDRVPSSRVALPSGWVPHIDRTDQQREIHAQLIRDMPTWDLVGDDWGTKRACLWEISRKARGGKDIPNLYQQTGSCVGHGAWRVMMELMCFEFYRLGDPGQYKTIFLPYHYGRGRFHAGISGRGEGSTGSGQAKAIQLDGVLDNDTAEFGLTQPYLKSGGLTWGADAEMLWSNGAKIDGKWIALGRQHLVKATSPVRSAKDVQAAIVNGYPVTIASNWGGKMRPPIKANRLLNSHADTWNHQMCILGWEINDDLGLIFYVMNSWGPETHGACPSGAPLGGFWVPSKDVDYITDQDDSFAYSQFVDFPRQSIVWDLV